MKTVWIVLALLIMSLAGCGGAADTPAVEPTATDLTVGLANPASVNCVDQGGTSRIESRPDGGQFGVCYFEDNRQCEEFALLRGDCPAGGVKVTGYVTEAGRYCAITGGTYTVTGTDAGGVETGSCTLPDETVCDAQSYYEGKCPATD